MAQEAAGAQSPKGLAAMKRALDFTRRLDEITTAVYPFPPLELLQQDENFGAAPFNPISWDSIARFLPSVLRLILQIFWLPVTLGILVTAAFREVSPLLSTAAAVTMAYMSVTDEQFAIGYLGWCNPNAPAEGLHSSRTKRNRSIIDRVPGLRDPNFKGTPWIRTGEMATLLPLFTFRPPKVSYSRRWLKVKSTDRRDVKVRSYGASCCRPTPYGQEDEAIALDIALPRSGLSPGKPFYLVLHGLSGGSNEGFVRDMTKTALERGSGVCVMIARGLMGTPLNGFDTWHSGRLDDIGATVAALNFALPDANPVALAGFSQGAITGANYTVATGAKAGVCCTVALSGSLDLRASCVYEHSVRIWQPILTFGMKAVHVKPHAARIHASKRGIRFKDIERAASLYEYNAAYPAKYHSFRNAMESTVDMSAGAEVDKLINGLKVPMLAVQALDDPILTSEGMPTQASVLDKVEDLFVLLTKTGGHVGWPTGWLPWNHGMSFMTNMALHFSEAVLEVGATRQRGQESTLVVEKPLCQTSSKLGSECTNEEFHPIGVQGMGGG